MHPSMEQCRCAPHQALHACRRACLGPPAQPCTRPLQKQSLLTCEPSSCGGCRTSRVTSSHSTGVATVMSPSSSAAVYSPPCVPTCSRHGQTGRPQQQQQAWQGWRTAGPTLHLYTLLQLAESPCHNLDPAAPSSCKTHVPTPASAQPRVLQRPPARRPWSWLRQSRQHRHCRRQSAAERPVPGGPPRRLAATPP